MSDTIGRPLYKEGEIGRGEDVTAKLKDQNRKLILIGILFFLVPVLFNIWRDSNLAIVKAVDIQEIRTIGSTDLCPGEKLKFEYHLVAKGTGVLVRDLTIWRVEPPKTVIFSEFRRFILDAPIDQALQEAYVIPYLYLNYEEYEMQRLPPGSYQRKISISSPSRSTVIDQDFVNFTIREDCY